MSIRWILPLLVVMGAVMNQAVAEDDLWVSYEGGEGIGKGKHIVFVTGDDEYRSEEACPQLAKILSVRHGFKTTVLFAIEPKSGAIKPDHQTNIPGMHHLATADMMVVFLRFRHLPDEDMKFFDDFVNSGKPILGMRTATHSFNYKNQDSKYYKYHWRASEWKGGFGQEVLGDTWISHHGHHKKESTRGIINPKFKDHPILRGVKDIWGPTDVYGIRNLKDAEVLVHGQVLTGMKPDDGPVEGAKNDPMMPLFWTKSFKGSNGKTSKVICTTMGASVDCENEGVRRFLINSVLWGVGLDVPEMTNVEIVGEFKPTFYGFGSFTKGIKPSDHKLR